MKVSNILPGFVWTEGLEAMLTDEASRGSCAKFGLGDPDTLLQQRREMLQPEDVAEEVWRVVSKPRNVCVNDVLIRDSIQ